jgi:tripartite-type tricarboxylate transporter receptor subunit TctC
MTNSALRGIAALCLCLCFPVVRAEFPEHPISLILPTPPGGVADMNARPIAKYLSEALRQPVVVVSKPGVGGALAYSSVARANPDGYTMLLGLSTISVLPEADRINGRTPSYALDQLTPVALLSAEPLMLLVRNDSPWRTVNDLVEDARKRPTKISYASSGNYGAIHFPMEMLAKAASINMLHVPYSGGGPALLALLGGQVDVTAAGPAAAKAAAADGRVRIIAHWGGQRIAMLPDVPTLKERGFDAEYYLWAGLFVPASTPPAIVDALRAAVRRSVTLPAYKEDMDKVNIPMKYMDGPEFAEFWKRDADTLVNLTRKIGRLE